MTVPILVDTDFYGFLPLVLFYTWIYTDVHWIKIEGRREGGVQSGLGSFVFGRGGRGLCNYLIDAELGVFWGWKIGFVLSNCPTPMKSSKSSNRFLFSLSFF